MAPRGSAHSLTMPPAARVIICGAGIAGLTLAWWLGRGGCRVLIVEKAARLRDEGYMFDFYGPGYTVAERMGLLRRLQELCYRVHRVSWIDEHERPVSELDYEVFRRLLDGRVLSLMRGDLVWALFDDLPDTVEVRFGREIKRLNSLETEIDVTLTSGENEVADVLIGADGIHSAMRAHLFGDEALFVRHLGFRAAAFAFEHPTLAQALRGELKLLSLRGRHVGFFPIRGGRIASFFVHRASPTATVANPLAELRAAFGDLGWLVPVALERAAALPSIYYDQVAQIELPRWRRHRVGLVGDACQAVSVLAAQGASLAMAAAYLLAQELLRQHSIEVALERYEALLKPAIEQQQAAGRRMARWSAPTTQWKLRLRNGIFALANQPGMSLLLKPMFTSAVGRIISAAGEPPR
jgi:2-polyprenyl-6-methoxyphenol hydroxylase-like FAD-dependent oxidoreductase